MTPYTSQGSPGVSQTGDRSDPYQLVNAFDILTKEAYNQLGSSGQAAFYVGDGLQRAALAGLFDLLNPKTWTPANILRVSSVAANQAARISELFISPEAARLTWLELQNKVEIFFLVKNSSSLFGSPQDIHLLRAIEKAYSLPAFQALWAVEGLGHDYAASRWRFYGPQKRLLWEENADVPEKSLLMLHAGLGLFLADWLLGSGTPTLIAHSPPAQFRAVIERFVSLVQDNARKGYVGPVVESLGLVTRDVHPDMVDAVGAAVHDAAPDLTGYYWHGVGRALYFSRQYFLPVLSTMWSGIGSDGQSLTDHQNVMAGLTWAVVLVNMRQPGIIEGMLRNNIRDSSLQDGFANGAASSIMVRNDTTPNDSSTAAFCHHQPRDRELVPLWNRLLSSPCKIALQKYYSAFRECRALEEVFQYQDLSELAGRLQGEAVEHQEQNVTERRAVNPWTWQDRLGFSQGIEIQNGHRIIYCAGQTSVDRSGNPLYPGDMAKQINQALDNLELILKDAGLTLANVVRLNYYTTDTTALSGAAPAYAPRLAAAGCKPVAMALGVTSLFRPELMIEIEATAVM
jgi:enamine deaminase RidA (YjgF/YER057c/UK114 family)